MVLLSWYLPSFPQPTHSSLNSYELPAHYILTCKSIILTEIIPSQFSLCISFPKNFVIISGLYLPPFITAEVLPWVPVALLSLIMKYITRIAQSSLLWKQTSDRFIVDAVLSKPMRKLKEHRSLHPQLKDKFSKPSAREKWRFWPGKTLQHKQTSNLEQAVLCCTTFMGF